MSDISKVKLPDNNTYDIKDASARTAIDNIVNGTTQLPYTLIKDATDTAQNLIKLGDGLSLDANNVLSAAGGARVHIMTFVDGVCQRFDGEPIMDAQIGDFLLFYSRIPGVTLPDHIGNNIGPHLSILYPQFPKYSWGNVSIPLKNWNNDEVPVILQIMYQATSSSYYCAVVGEPLAVDFYQGTRGNSFSDTDTAAFDKLGVRVPMTVNTAIDFKNGTSAITPVATYKNVYEGNRLVYSIYCSSQIYLKDISFTITESNNEIFIPEFLDGGGGFGKLVYDSTTGVYTITNVAATTRNKCISVVGRFYKYAT